MLCRLSWCILRWGSQGIHYNPRCTDEEGEKLKEFTMVKIVCLGKSSSRHHSQDLWFVDGTKVTKPLGRSSYLDRSQTLNLPEAVVALLAIICFRTKLWIPGKDGEEGGEGSGVGMAGKRNRRRKRDWLASEEESLCSARLPLSCNHQEHSSVKERVQEFQTQVKFM